MDQPKPSPTRSLPLERKSIVVSATPQHDRVMVRNIEDARAQSDGLGVGGCKRQRVQGIEAVFVKFRKQSIGRHRIGRLRLDRPKQPLNRPKAVIRQSLCTLRNLDHRLGGGDGPDVGKSKPDLHRKEYLPELIVRDLIVGLLDANARSIGGVTCIVKSRVVRTCFSRAEPGPARVNGSSVEVSLLKRARGSLVDMWKALGRCCRLRMDYGQTGSNRVLVGTGRFELPTPRTPSECSTRLSHVPTGRNRPHLANAAVGLT